MTDGGGGFNEGYDALARDAFAALRLREQLIRQTTPLVVRSTVKPVMRFERTRAIPHGMQLKLEAAAKRVEGSSRSPRSTEVGHG
jgi:hypothetical protein